ncbi:MAG: adenosyl-hopene transferase HpnH [Actinobacteria bacterium]|nr:adenosyl-hopene transferase HpnH [Actinomycetota bacterium]
MLISRYRGNIKFPFALMLEPLFKCNLNCSGCGRIREYKGMINLKLTTEECIDASMQAGAPIVSITGGEPLLHPQITTIVKELLDRKFFVYLCTNGLLLEDFLNEIKPRNELSLVVHLDGLNSNHGRSSGSEIAFEKAFKAIKKAVKMNFKVRTNTTIYSYTDIKETAELFSKLMKTGVQGVLVSPAFSYGDIEDKLFLSRAQSRELFSCFFYILNGTRIYNTPLYWEFLRGRSNLQCTPWANPTFNPAGWKSPCYLVTDSHFKTYSEFLGNTNWEKYGVGKDKRCTNCMMHSGFEASAINSMKFSNLGKMIKWNFTGRIK